MKKIFLIPLMTLLTCVMAWAGNQPAKAIEPVPFQFTAAAPAQKAAAPIRMAKAEIAEQNVLLEYGEVSQNFTSLQAAFNALPENSTPATVTLLSDIQESYNKNAMVVARFHNVTLDLNGWTIYSSSDLAASSALIQNNGTLTITDSSVGGTGSINNQNTNPEDWIGNDQPFPYVAHNTITNCGTLNINAGTLMNYSEGGACYVVDNNSTSYDAILNISDRAVLLNTKNDAIRQFCNSTKYKNEVNISGGEVTGNGRAVWMQLPGSSSASHKLGSFNMTGGKIVGDGYAAFFLYSYGDSEDKVTVSISGGEISGGIAKYNVSGAAGGNAQFDITGGTFDTPFSSTYYFYSWNQHPAHAIISGGVFKTEKGLYWTLEGAAASGAQYADPEFWKGKGWTVEGDNIINPYTNVVTYSLAAKAAEGAQYGNREYWENNNYSVDADGNIYEDTYFSAVAPDVKGGYCKISETPVEGEDDSYWSEVGPCNKQEVTESKTMEEIAQEIETAGEEVAASVIVINTAATEEAAVVTVEADIAVEGIVIKNDNNKEGQIVVESGVTLTVGNSGIVSENNDLTTVVVKPGGTIMIGNGGVDQQGTAIPVEIQSTGTESGVFMVDPNAPATVAEAPAKVKVYTRAHKDNGIEYWQQLASPVKGSTITVTPLGELQGNENFLTSVYEWDYATDSWARITAGMEEISEGVYAFRGDAVWNTSDAVLKPFAAYDLINNSHASHGGVTYEFAGELVGNEDMVLNFPENGFCTFGNSYTAPIDLSTLFAKITNDMQASTNLNNTNIDPCVYMYNSSADRFESVNSLGLWLKELGIMDVAFSQIPPQQAFVMNLLSGNSAQSAVDYATCVWGNPNPNKNTPILAPSRQQAASFSALINIEVTDGEATDRVVLIEDEKYSEAYDNGADAEKYMNNTFNIYANAERNLAMVATDNIENTELSFKAGKAVNYTMTFGKTMGDFVLVDRANNSQIAIVEGGIYTFAAQPNATAEARFAVVPAPKMPTAIENTGVKTNVKGIYTIMGQYLGENFDILPAGVYVIDGVKIVK